MVLMEKKFDIEFEEEGLGSLENYVMACEFEEYADMNASFSININGVRLKRVGDLISSLSGLLKGISEGEKEVSFRCGSGFTAFIDDPKTKILVEPHHSETWDYRYETEMPTKEFIETIVSISKKLLYPLCATEVKIDEKEKKERGLRDTYQREAVEQFIPKIEKNYLGKEGIVPDDLHIPKNKCIGAITLDYKLPSMLFYGYKDPMTGFSLILPKDKDSPIYSKDNKLVLHFRNKLNFYRKELPKIIRNVREENPEEISIPLDKEREFKLVKEKMFYEGDDDTDDISVELTDERRKALLSKLERFSAYLNHMYHWTIGKGDNYKGKKEFDIDFKTRGTHSLWDYIRHCEFTDDYESECHFFIKIGKKRIKQKGNIISAICRIMSDISSGKKSLEFSADFPGFKAKMGKSKTTISTSVKYTPSWTEYYKTEIPTYDFLYMMVSLAKSVLYSISRRIIVQDEIRRTVSEAIPDVEKRFLDEPGQVPKDVFVKPEDYVLDIVYDPSYEYDLADYYKPPFLGFSADFTFELRFKDHGDNYTSFRFTNEKERLRNNLSLALRNLRHKRKEELGLDRRKKVILYKNQLIIKNGLLGRMIELKLTPGEREQVISKHGRFSEHISHGEEGFSHGDTGFMEPEFYMSYDNDDLEEYSLIQEFSDEAQKKMRYKIKVNTFRMKREDDVIGLLNKGLKSIVDEEEVADFSYHEYGFSAKIEGSTTRISVQSSFWNENFEAEMDTIDFIEMLLSFAKRVCHPLCKRLPDISLKELKEMGEDDPLRDIVENLIPEIEQRYFDRSAELPKNLYLPRKDFFCHLLFDDHIIEEPNKEEKNPIISFALLIPKDKKERVDSKDNYYEIEMSNEADVLKGRLQSVIKKIREGWFIEAALPLDEEKEVFLKRDSLYINDPDVVEKEFPLTPEKKEHLLSKLERLERCLSYIYAEKKQNERIWKWDMT